MTDENVAIETIEACARQSHTEGLNFGAMVERLAAVGVESYHADYRGGLTTYYLGSGQAHAVKLPFTEPPIAEAFAGHEVREAIRGAQQGEVMYPEFVRRTRAAGCVGYDVWIAGKHVVYHGRRGERHVEWFPGAAAPSRANVEVVKQVYAAFGRRDLAAAMALFAPNVQIDQSPEVPWGDHYEGLEEAREFFARLTRRLDSTLALEGFVDAGDHVVAIGRTQGAERDRGRRYDVPIAHVWQVRDGRVVRVLFCIDNPTMLASLT